MALKPSISSPDRLLAFFPLGSVDLAIDCYHFSCVMFLAISLQSSTVLVQVSLMVKNHPVCSVNVIEAQTSSLGILIQ